MPSKTKTVTFAEALKIIDDATAVMVDGSNFGDAELIYPDVDTGDDGAITLQSEVSDWTTNLTEDENKIVNVQGDGKLVFLDDNGREVILMPLVAHPVK